MHVLLFDVIGFLGFLAVQILLYLLLTLEFGSVFEFQVGQL
jgi:hypothetical protein